MQEYETLDSEIKQRMQNIGVAHNPEDMAIIHGLKKRRAELNRQARSERRIGQAVTLSQEAASTEFLKEHGKLPEVATPDESDNPDDVVLDLTKLEELE